ncbi:MAG TPA: septum formation initiator family protein [Acidimicrobiales bacterium]|nr:septum formation initiator family protein [Acidimicrobiales bacterium]
MIYRARLLLVLSIVVAVVIVATELPVASLLHEKQATATAAQKLATLQQENKALVADVHALDSQQTIAWLAHAEFGLVRPGQQSYVILPSSGDSSAGNNPLGYNPLPGIGIVPSGSDSVDATPPSSAKPAKHGQSLWSRVVSRLEFWKWAF